MLANYLCAKGSASRSMTNANVDGMCPTCLQLVSLSSSLFTPHRFFEQNRFNDSTRRRSLHQIWQSEWLALDVWSHGRLSMSPSRGCYETAITQCTAAAFFGSRRILIHKIRDRPRTCGSQGTLCDMVCIGSSEARLLGRRTGQLDVVRMDGARNLLAYPNIEGARRIVGKRSVITIDDRGTRLELGQASCCSFNQNSLKRSDNNHAYRRINSSGSICHRNYDRSCNQPISRACTKSLP